MAIMLVNGTQADIRVNFLQLLTPIAGEMPAGIDLRADLTLSKLYYQIKDARAQARTAERMLLQSSEITNTKSNWQEVINLATEILEKHSKDLEIATWLTEALLREYGFAGLRDGFQLMHQLINNFWDDLYPREDEEGIATKVASLAGLNGIETEGTLIVPIAMVPLITENSAGTFALWQYQQAIEVSRISAPDKRAQRIANGAIELEAIQEAARKTPPLFFHELYADLTGCIEAFVNLDKLLTEKCGMDAPPASRIQAQLTACLDCLTAVTPESNVVQESLSPIVADTASSQLEPVITVNKNSIQFSAREEALQMLLHTAEFFRRAEPHSPLSYILERTVRWGQLPLPELLKELVKDEPAWEHVCNLTGIVK